MSQSNHADLVSHYSDTLDYMIKGRMAEAQNEYVILEEVGEGTFKRFLKWAYKRYYTAADFEMKPSSPLSPTPSNEDDNIRIGRGVIEGATDQGV